MLRDQALRIGEPEIKKRFSVWVARLKGIAHGHGDKPAPTALDSTYKAVSGRICKAGL
jgi:hypothetical protein